MISGAGCWTRVLIVRVVLEVLYRGNGVDCGEIVC